MAHTGPEEHYYIYAQTMNGFNTIDLLTDAAIVPVPPFSGQIRLNTN